MATEIIAYRAPSPQGVRFEGSTPHDHALLLDIPQATDLKLTVVAGRNLQYHKMFFAMLKTAFDYMDEADRIRLNILTTEELLNRLKLDLGLYDITVVGSDVPGMPEGTILYKPQSISFAKMDQTAFKQFFKSCLGVIIQKYVPTQTADSLNDAVLALLRFE